MNTDLQLLFNINYFWLFPNLSFNRRLRYYVFPALFCLSLYILKYFNHAYQDHDQVSVNLWMLDGIQTLILCGIIVEDLELPVRKTEELLPMVSHMRQWEQQHRTSG